MPQIDPYFTGRARAAMTDAGAPDADVTEIAAWAQAERAAHPSSTSKRSIVVDADGHILATALTTQARNGLRVTRVTEVSDPAHEDLVDQNLDQALALLRERLGRPVVRLNTSSLTQGAGTGRITGRRAPEPGRMVGAELQAVREYLGLTLADLGGLLGVRQDTVHRWESGRDTIPARLPSELDALEDATVDAVDALVDALTDDPEATARLYHRTEDLHAARPEYAQWPARWWRHVTMRALEQVDRDVTIEAVR